jgi:hypothetical protein
MALSQPTFREKRMLAKAGHRNPCGHEAHPWLCLRAGARRGEEAGPRFERSLELARELDADYEVALTLEAMARTGLGAPEAEAESQAILERLGVLSTPLGPLP